MKNKIWFLLTAFVLCFSSCTIINVNSTGDLEIETPPSKTVFEVGERFITYGLKVVDKKTKANIKDFDTTPSVGYIFRKEDIGDYTVTISKEKYNSTSFQIEISPYGKYLEIKSLPHKTSYYIGDSFSLEGLVVIDSVTQKEAVSFVSSIEEGHVFSLNDLGEQEVVLSLENYLSASFKIEVKISGDQELALYKQSAIREIDEYFKSFNIDLYDENGKKELADAANSYKEQILNASNIEEISSLLKDAKKAMDNVPVYQDDNHKIIGISIDCFPSRRIYSVNDELDLLGLDVSLNFNDGDKQIIRNYSIDEVDMSLPKDKQPITIRYGEFETSFDISIKEKNKTGTQIVSIYATNDIHGQVDEQNNRSSIGKVMTYLKEKGEQENTLLLDQGDTWQGSIYSNYNHGELITDMMNYIHYDARTVGNHDFDWGVDYVKRNGEASYQGYRTPVLAANIYDFDFDTKQIGNMQQEKLGVKTVSYTLENGLKVGVIGNIGKNQITSISSFYTHDIAFVDHIKVIKEEATRLRSEGCEVIISSNHCGQEDLIGNGLSEYVDLVLCAHTHQQESTLENGLFFAQYGAYNQAIGHIDILYDQETKKISYQTRESIAARTVDRSVASLDSEIENILSKYKEQCDKSANEIVANNVRGSFYSSEQLPNLMCKAVYDKAVEEGYDIDLSYVNVARASLYNSLWTYADIYQAFPFDNEILIIEVSYNEMRTEISEYNYVYRDPSFSGIIDKNRTYTVACLDFLTFHTNTSRFYDYFPDNNGHYIGILEDNYRVILKEWLINNGYNKDKQLLSTDYSSSLESFSRNFTFN